MNRRSPARVAVALLVLLAVPGAALGAQVVPLGGYEVVCCCGPHVDTEHCGCADCPAAPRSLVTEQERDALAGPEMAPCHGRRDVAASMAGIDWALPPAPPLMARAAPPAVDLLAPAPATRAADPPPTPPPR